MKDYFKKGFSSEVTHGVCPTCKQPTLLISITKDFYRCITCGTDLEQKINGVIKYIPTLDIKEDIKPEA